MFKKFAYILCYVAISLNGYCSELYCLREDKCPIYSQELIRIIPDLHELINKGYLSTKKDENGEYVNPFCLENDQLFVSNLNDVWCCLANFSGEKGCFDTSQLTQRILKNCLNIFAKLLGVQNNNDICTDGSARGADYPGFVAYSIPDDNQPVWIVIVFRGTQSQESSLLRSIITDNDWRTNLSVAPTNIDENLFGFPGKMHSGYVLKIKSCMRSIEDSLRQVMQFIPDEKRGHTKVVICGHSQGGALAQIYFPIFLHTMCDTLGIKKSNVICYTLSTPPSITDAQTLNNYYQNVDQYAIISHILPEDIVSVASVSGYLTPGIVALDDPYIAFVRAGLCEFKYMSQRKIIRQLRSNFITDYFDIQGEVWTLKDDVNIKIFWTNIFDYIAHSASLFEKLIANPSEELFLLIQKALYEKLVVFTAADIDKLKQVYCDSINVLPEIDNFHKLCYAFANDVPLQGALNVLSGNILNNYKKEYNVDNTWKKMLKISAYLNVLPQFSQVMIKKFLESATYLMDDENISFLWSQNNSLVEYLHFGTKSHFNNDNIFFDYHIPSTNLNAAVQFFYSLHENE